MIEIASAKKSVFLFFIFLIICIPRSDWGDEVGSSDTVRLQQYRLKITGLKCRSCIPDVQKILSKVPGVRSARVTEFDKMGSTIFVETVPGKVVEEQLISALTATGFQAEILSVGKPRSISPGRETGFNAF